jgi:hypothetical protein
MWGCRVAFFSLSTMPRASKLSHFEVFLLDRRPRVRDERKTQVALRLNVIASVLHYGIGIYYVVEEALAFIRKGFGGMEDQQIVVRNIFSLSR